MGAQMIIRIDPKTKDKFYRAARMEGKTASEKVREMVEDYIEKSDLSAVVDDLWGRFSEKARTRGITEADVERTIREVRVSKGKR
ncbi:MAG: ribbon-helix-helix protein, CopG family [Thermodesulfovibrionales bacterium]|nr:ribbon-helix-helix protein, CopG family [Thermodesulfovibrionales bacterium]